MKPTINLKFLRFNNHRFCNHAFALGFVFSMIAISTSAFADASQGPTGRRGGGAFYDSSSWNESLAALSVRHGAVIDAVSLVFRNNTNGTLRFSARRGGGGGGLTSISLRNNEKITYISGYWGRYGSIDVVRRLYVGTNQGRYFSMGTTNSGSRYFSYNNPNVSSFSLRGLRGRSGALLDAVGVVWGSH